MSDFRANIDGAIQRAQAEMAAGITPQQAGANLANGIRASVFPADQIGPDKTAVMYLGERINHLKPELQDKFAPFLQGVGNTMQALSAARAHQVSYQIAMNQTQAVNA